MRIALISEAFFESWGGSQIVWQHAYALSKCGYEVTVFTLKGNAQPPTGVSLVHLGMPKNKIAERIFHIILPLNFPFVLKHLAVLKEYDLLYAYDYPASWLAYVVNLHYGTRYIFGFFHLQSPANVSGFLRRNYVKYFNLLEKITLKKAYSVTAISHFSRRQLKDWINIDSFVVYPFINFHRFDKGADPSGIKKKYNLGDGPIILSIGSLYPLRGMHLLIEAFRSVNRRFPDAKLILAGRHEFSGYAKKIYQMCDDSVIITGAVPGELIPSLYAACDVYATGTLLEGFNLPLAEAQACGKPVVAFDVGPHPEVAINGQTGILVTARDVDALASAMNRLLSDDKLRYEFGEHGYNMIRSKFSEANFTAQFVEFNDRMVDGLSEK